MLTLAITLSYTVSSQQLWLHSSLLLLVSLQRPTLYCAKCQLAFIFVIKIEVIFFDVRNDWIIYDARRTCYMVFFQSCSFSPRTCARISRQCVKDTSFFMQLCYAFTSFSKPKMNFSKSLYRYFQIVYFAPVRTFSYQNWTFDRCLIWLWPQLNIVTGPALHKLGKWGPFSFCI